MMTSTFRIDEFVGEARESPDVLRKAVSTVTSLPSEYLSSLIRFWEMSWRNCGAEAGGYRLSEARSDAQEAKARAPEEQGSGNKWSRQAGRSDLA